MRRVMDDLEYLRNKALNSMTTKKVKKTRLPLSEGCQVESDFGIDRLIDKYSRRPAHRECQTNPELSHHVMKSFPGRKIDYKSPRKSRSQGKSFSHNYHPHSPTSSRRNSPASGRRSPKYSRRGSVSSSFSTSTTSLSSYSSSHLSRSRSRSSSYSRSCSSSGSYSSYSSSSRSRSASPAFPALKRKYRNTIQPDHEKDYLKSERFYFHEKSSRNPPKSIHCGVKSTVMPRSGHVSSPRSKPRESNSRHHHVYSRSSETSRYPSSDRFVQHVHNRHPAERSDAHALYRDRYVPPAASSLSRRSGYKRSREPEDEGSHHGHHSHHSEHRSSQLLGSRAEWELKSRKRSKETSSKGFAGSSHSMRSSVVPKKSEPSKSKAPVPKMHSQKLPSGDEKNEKSNQQNTNSSEDVDDRFEQKVDKSGLEQNQSVVEKSSELSVEEELDYNENMDELDLYPVGDLDINDSEEKGGSQSVGSPTEHDVAICSPIRVSPERRSSSDKNEGGRNGDKLPVKERLYLSKTAIERKRRIVEPSSPKLRPSLASRLGPSPSSRRQKSRHPKGNAFAIAEAYRRKKQQELQYQRSKRQGTMREEDVQRARRMTKSLNETSSRSHSRSKGYSFDHAGSDDREKALSKRIDRIKEKNKAIVKRNEEIKRDRELYE